MPIYLRRFYTKTLKETIKKESKESKDQNDSINSSESSARPSFRK